MKLTRSALRSAVPASLMLMAACGGGATTSAGGGAAPAAVAITPELIAQGRVVFSTTGRCGVCHGQTGGGGRIAPSLADDIWLWIDPAQPIHPQLVNIIRIGVPQPREAEVPMPPMGGAQLTQDELNAVAAFVGSL